MEVWTWEGYSGYSVWQAFIWEGDFSTASAFVALVDAGGTEPWIWVVLVQWQKYGVHDWVFIYL